MSAIETIIITIAGGLIGGFVSYYFAEKTENYKFELLKKEQASKVAELFALWVKHNDNSLKKLSIDKRNNYIEKLNKLTWELTIWIPDEKIVMKIMNKLSHKSKSEIKQIILQIRETIQNKKCNQLKWKDIVNFKVRDNNLEEELIPSPSAPPIEE